MLLIAAAFAAQVAPATQLPEWMAGCWEQRSGDEWTEECWSAPRSTMMIGYSLSGTGGVVHSWEWLQIERVETDDPVIDPLSLSASPGGKGPTKFAFSPSSEPGVTFVNLSNDYPQRIRYWREGRDLLAEISLGDGSRPTRWRYAPKGR